MSESTALTVIERARVAIGVFKREAELIALAASTTDITTITNVDGYKQVHAARMVLKNERLGISKLADEARKDAKAFNTACIAEERRIIGLIQPEEERLEKIQKDWDDAREAEKQAKIAAEMARAKELQERVAELRGCPTLSPTSGSSLIAAHIADLEGIAVDESFQELHQQATEAKAAGLDRLRALHSAAVAHEAEQARIQTEREELARLREEAARRDAADRARLAEEERVARERREAEAAEQRRVADLKERLADLRAQATIPSNWPASKIEAQFKLVQDVSTDESIWQEFATEAEAIRLQVTVCLQVLHAAALAREAEDRRIQEERAELDRQRREQEARQADIDRQEREAREAEERRQAAELAETERKQREAAEQRARQERRQRALESPPPAMDIVKTLAAAYDVEIDIAMEWLTTIDFSEIETPESVAA